MTFAVVVARTSLNGLEYLERETGRAQWVGSAQHAVRFQNIREGTRAALRLPGSMRAFAFPMESMAEL
ncbi:hypothetical protein [Phenylobacterium sp.]|jgi:hypothetical protein|uniref:hypothetical protein n=1 Tax=Phenylobacterium sp. TaxID=1871053 RepID=UPI002F410C18